MLTNILTSRFAGPILAVLAALALAGGLFGGIQTYRLGNSQKIVVAQQESIKAQALSIATLNAQIATRDGLIAKQNEGIEALKKVREQEREAYLRQYAAADQRAKSNDARAKELLSLQASGDELAQCRASRALLEQELVR